MTRSYEELGETFQRALVDTASIIARRPVVLPFCVLEVSLTFAAL